ncbi:ATP-binding protein [Paenibacillus sp. y28]|uniref:ATP-binding protein n=1 Tax=Paenibacillus sp. y28 TaxID=3129110 RepID=UPI0030180F38
MLGVRKHRSFTSELLLWILLLVVLPLAALLAYINISSFSSVQEIEKEKALLSSHAVHKSIENLGDTIQGVTVTNGYWEQNRQALISRDMDWLGSNIGDMPSIVPNIDFAAETDLAGNVIVQAGDVAELTGQIGYPLLLERAKDERVFTGLLNTSRGLAVIAVSQVTDEMGQQPSAGLLITGRLLTAEIVQKIRDTLQTDIALQLYSGQLLASGDSLQDDWIGQDLKPPEADGPGKFVLERKNEVYFSQVDAPLRDMNGQVIGLMHTRIASLSATQAASNLSQLTIVVSVIMAFLLLLVIYLLRLRIIMPLRHFTASLQRVAAGETVETVPKHVLQAEAEIVHAIQQIMHWNQALEQTVERRTAEIRNLLDHARQGFMSIGPDLTVRGEYSVECVRLLGCEPGGLPVGPLLYPEDEEGQLLLLSILTSYYEESDAMRKELMFSLLPEELHLHGRIIKAEYQCIPWTGQPSEEQADRIMIMLTDYTETRRLEHRMQEEQRMLQMVVQTITHPEEYMRITKDFETFHQTEIREILAAGHSALEKAVILCRMIHTFKGSFGLLQFVHVVPRLHELETKLQRLLEAEADLTAARLAALLQEERIGQWLEEDTALLRAVLGTACDELLQNQDIRLSREQWLAIEHKLERIATAPEELGWLKEFRTWRYRPVYTLFQPYLQYLSELADRSGILLHPVELQGGDISVDPERLYGFARSFVHVVRNVIVHGIEPPDERIASGKDEYGQVSFRIEQTGDALRITLGDDGRGIDPVVLRRKAGQQGLPEHLTDEETLLLIFQDRLSTAQQVTEIGGRGVGLSVVKDEVEQLGGTIEIRSQVGTGTSFVFTLPAAP